MDILPITDDTVFIDAGNPLDYRTFIDSKRTFEPVSLTRSPAHLQVRTNESRLARLFANRQWCFGHSIVDLAELEEMEPLASDLY